MDKSSIKLILNFINVKKYMKNNFKKNKKCQLEKTKMV